MTFYPAPVNLSTPSTGSATRQPVNSSTLDELIALFPAWRGAHSRLPAAHRGECSPYSRRCACGEPKRPIESACKPCRLRRQDARERARVELAANNTYWNAFRGDL